MSSTMIIGGVDLRELQAAHAEHPALANWREVSQAVIGHYVKANAALGDRLQDVADHHEALEQHISVLEDQNRQLSGELEPDQLAEEES